MANLSLLASDVALFLRSAYHTIRILLLILVGIILKPKPSAWIPKVYSNRPAVLQDPRYGQHKYAQLSNVKIHYVENGDPSKKLIVFIHGFPEFWYSWRRQLEQFGRDYWCVALDLRGYSDSDKPKGVENYKMDKITDDIKELIHHLGREKCILVGHDWGAVIGFHFVSKHKQMIEKYCMMDAPPSPVFSILYATDLEQYAKSWYIAFFQAPILPEYSMTINDYEKLKAIGGNNFNENFTENDLQAYKYTFSQPGALTSAINYYRANLKNGRSASSKRKVDTNETHPTGLYLLGERDAYISKATGPLAQKLIPNLDFKIVKDSDHFLQQTNPVVVNEILKEFFAD